MSLLSSSFPDYLRYTTITNAITSITLTLFNTPNSRIATSIHYIPSWTRHQETIRLTKQPNGTNHSIHILVELQASKAGITKTAKSIVCSLLDDNDRIIERKIVRVFSKSTTIAKSNTGEYRTRQTLKLSKKRRKHTCERTVPDPLEFDVITDSE